MFLKSKKSKGSLRFLPVAWPRAAAPEATHRCTSQLAKAATRWSSGCSRSRWPWMRRTVRAVASDEDWGGNLMKHGIEDVDGSNFLWSRLHPILHYPSILLKKERILRSDLLLSKGSYRAIVWNAHHNPKIVPELAEFPFWCEVMWELHLCRSHYLNQSCFLVTARLVRPCSASYMKYQEQGSTTDRWIIFKWSGVPITGEFIC